MAPKVEALGVAADPFASRPVATTLPMSQPEAPRQGMDQAFQAAREVDLGAAGIPQAKPGWLLPVVVGILALVVGGAVTLVVMMH